MDDRPARLISGAVLGLLVVLGGLLTAGVPDGFLRAWGCDDACDEDCEVVSELELAAEDD
jgi:hypothetical protein